MDNEALGHCVLCDYCSHCTIPLTTTLLPKPLLARLYPCSIPRPNGEPLVIIAAVSAPNRLINSSSSSSGLGASGTRGRSRGIPGLASSPSASASSNRLIGTRLAFTSGSLPHGTSSNPRPSFVFIWFRLYPSSANFKPVATLAVNAALRQRATSRELKALRPVGP